MVVKTHSADVRGVKLNHKKGPQVGWFFSVWISQDIVRLLSSPMRSEVSGGVLGPLPKFTFELRGLQSVKREGEESVSPGPPP
jgi:hypothetical protein